MVGHENSPKTVFENMLQVPADKSNPTEERFFLVGSSLNEEENKEMVAFL